MKLQLLFFEGCPNRAAARAALDQALAHAGVQAQIHELDVNADTTPAALRSWGSPTILIDGEDVGGETRPTGRSCRLYRDPRGRTSGAPDLERIAAALRRALRGRVAPGFSGAR